MSRRRSVVAGTLLIAFAAFEAAHAAETTPTELARGAYIVNAGGCADCHTPLMTGPAGPVRDTARGLSGHPQDVVLPPPPAPQGPWIAGSSATNTAFYGPWGISYAINLTPDPATGIGNWQADQFVAAITTGKHLGVGRPILPPMPWRTMARFTDADLRAVFAYLQSLPAVVNRVPDAVIAPHR